MSPTKTQIVERIAGRLGVESPPMSSGSTEPKRIFELIVEELSLPIEPEKLTKPDLAHAIVKEAELRWSPVTCESSGGTVTKAGLDLVWQAVEILIGDGDFHHG
ncbi:MAG: hypothetical protein LC789_16140 [Actinobacteria bacterium]|nr:hypothetical protein [Actinomycetota bacterium]